DQLGDQTLIGRHTHTREREKEREKEVVAEKRERRWPKKKKKEKKQGTDVKGSGGAGAAIDDRKSADKRGCVTGFGNGSKNQYLKNHWRMDRR
ncbi:hypothetical protein PIB30_111018, partial [Stylosanthes scabra]|nr:hypothetical protein [Stylosanthes scabra]